MQKYLVAGLGNPEKRFENTRHNMGFEVVKKIAFAHEGIFTEKRKVKGLIASYHTDAKKVYLLLPLTYMNDSGVSIKLAIEFYQIPLANILIIIDDIAINLGEFRMRTDSGTGGHNGLKSVQQHLHTQNYARLRIGVGKGPGDVTKYVLGKFNEEEKKILPDILQKASGFVDAFIQQGLTEAMNVANIKQKQNKEQAND